MNGLHLIVRRGRCQRALSGARQRPPFEAVVGRSVMVIGPPEKGCSCCVSVRADWIDAFTGCDRRGVVVPRVCLVPIDGLEETEREKEMAV